MTRPLCLVTGASAGIGAAFARAFASHGYDLVLTARRGDRLEALAVELRQAFGAESICVVADLSQPGAVDAVLKAVADRGRVIDALVNNAGFSLAGPYLDSDWEAQAKFMQVMTVTMAELAHKLLPGMVARRCGRIVNVASVAGLTPGAAGHMLYGAAKAFVVKMSESLHLEVRTQGVHVTVLCPGFTYSEFHDVNGTRDLVSRLPKWMWLDADEIAAEAFSAVEANRPLCIPSLPYKAIVALSRSVPESWALAAMGRYSNRIRKA
jgi:short-subunit dehydrogenase